MVSSLTSPPCPHALAPRRNALKKKEYTFFRTRATQSLPIRPGQTKRPVQNPTNNKNSTDRAINERAAGNNTLRTLRV